MDVNRAVVDLRVLPPNAVEELSAGEHPARLFEEKFEQPEFGRAG